MSFLSPLYFLFLLIIPMIWFLAWRESRRGAHFRVSEHLRRIYGGKRDFYIPLILRTIIIVLFVIVLADPVTTSTRTEVEKKGIDIVFVLDLSKSMLAEDVKPNRVEAAKKVFASFVDRLVSDRVWVVLFAGKPFLSTPLTFDYNAVKDTIKNISTDSINQSVPGLSGTAMGDGLLVATDMLEKSRNTDPKQKREQVIIVLTDGAANLGIDPKVATKVVAEKGIKTYTIGIGDPVGTELFVTDSTGNKQYFRDEKWQPLRADLDEKTLRFVAETTGGTYYNARDEQVLAKVFDTLSRLTKTDVSSNIIREHNPVYEPFILTLLITFGILFGYNLWRKIGVFGA